MACSQGCSDCGRCSKGGYSTNSPASGSSGNYSRAASYSPSSQVSYSTPSQSYPAESNGEYQ